ncbi:hypothetical protein HMPREF9080_01875 [Cardiobacterium valvarum F0432]|uniref:Uncharacterized protein n=1 Tax=Cardiobacterium valvarum F0432 TaxID=797473 RepID=G9ZGH1_9GAMM|nr:hypothetical protein HMPREF9080_01875 [Cardiobacterium valvarum F0432]
MTEEDRGTSSLYRLTTVSTYLNRRIIPIKTKRRFLPLMNERRNETMTKRDVYWIRSSRQAG